MIRERVQKSIWKCLEKSIWITKKAKKSEKKKIENGGDQRERASARTRERERETEERETEERQKRKGIER